MSQLWKQWKSWRNHQPSSCDQKNGPKSRDLYYLEERSTSQRTSNFNWKSSSYIMIHQLQNIRDNGRHWSWLHIIIGGLVLPCRSRTMYQDVTIVKEWSLFQKSQQKSLSPMKLPHNLGKISPQTLLLASQKHKDIMHYLSHVAIIQNRHISFLCLQPLQPEV